MATEVVQELFTHIWQNQKILTIKGSPVSYLFVATKNNALNKIKREINIKKTEQAYNQNTSNNEEIINSDLFIKKLKEALNKIPEKCRTIYCMKNFDGLTYKEIASFLNISERTVDAQIYKALKKLRLLLAGVKHNFYSNEI